MSSFRVMSRGRAATKGSFCSLLLRSCLWPTCLPLSLHFSAASQTRRHRRKHWTSQGSLPSKPLLRDERWREGKRSHTSTLEGISATFHRHGNFQTFCSLLCGLHWRWIHTDVICSYKESQTHLLSLTVTWETETADTTGITVHVTLACFVFCFLYFCHFYAFIGWDRIEERQESTGRKEENGIGKGPRAGNRTVDYLLRRDFGLLIILSDSFITLCHSFIGLSR